MSDADPSAAILAKLEAILGKVVDRDHNPDLAGKPVPYETFQRELRRAQAAEAGLSALKADVLKMQTDYETGVKSLREEAAAQVARIQQQGAEDLELYERHQLDAAGRAELRRVYGTMPEARRPKSPAELWDSWSQAHKAHAADPEKAPAPEVPRTLASYLPQPEAPAAGGGNTVTRSTGAGSVVVGRRTSPDRGVVTGARQTAAEKVHAAQTPADFWAALQAADQAG